MHFIEKEPTQKREDFVNKLKSNKILRVPGAYNPLTAKLIEEIGYDAVYVSGGVMANDLGFPDIGLTTLQDVSTRSYLISRVTNLPTIVDIDTGFKSCKETIETFEEFGITAVHLEDQIERKRCGHLDNKELISTEAMVKKETLYVFVSQSGETADTYAALDLCKQNSVKTCAVVNVVESSIARDSDFVLPIHCGTEIGVASTKAFLGQILILYILALKLALLRKDIEKTHFDKKINDLKNLPKLIEQTLLIDNKIQTISNTFNEAKGSMFLGRGFSYPIALEGALKLKELSYIHAEGYPAGEMKHGPLALIEEGMPVVVLAPRDNYYKKTISNMQEVIARGAKVLLITNKSKDEVISENIWEKIEVESTNEDLLPFLLTIPLQKLAYYSALKKGYDIDKPRNLAKSVTVE